MPFFFLYQKMPTKTLFKYFICENKNERMLYMNCKFKRDCKNADTQACNDECFAFVVLHGVDGNRGYWNTTRVPKKYQNCLMDNLPIAAANPRAYEVVQKYCKDVLYYTLEKGMGMFLFSIPNTENPLGTGTGKTTSAVTMLNEFLIARVSDYIKDDFSFKENPTVFVKLSELQNLYNGQFRGTYETQGDASKKYYTLINRMKTAELVVVDDIGIRDLTEPFKNELYDVIDTRVTNDLATIYTSNYPLTQLNEILGERITSRIEGQCYQLGFKGEDFRKGGLFR